VSKEYQKTTARTSTTPELPAPVSVPEVVSVAMDEIAPFLEGHLVVESVEDERPVGAVDCALDAPM